MNNLLDVELSKRLADRGLFGYLGEMEKTNLNALLSALAQPTRREIFEAIAKAEGGMNSTDVADATGTMPTNTSAHLTVLRNAGLVTARRNGKMVNYRAEHDVMKALVRYLSGLTV